MQLQRARCGIVLFRLWKSSRNSIKTIVAACLGNGDIIICDVTIYGYTLAVSFLASRFYLLTFRQIVLEKKSYGEREWAWHAQHVRI